MIVLYTMYLTGSKAWAHDKIDQMFCNIFFPSRSHINPNVLSIRAVLTCTTVKYNQLTIIIVTRVFQEMFSNTEILSLHLSLFRRPTTTKHIGHIEQDMLCIIL